MDQGMLLKERDLKSLPLQYFPILDHLVTLLENVVVKG